MVARPAPALPSGDVWAFEPKADGFRALAIVTGGRVQLQSRQQRSLTRAFPEIVEALRGRFGEVVLDGELVVCRHGRLDFVALQRRLAGGASGGGARASYMAFDVLAAGPTDLRGYPYWVRREVLLQLLGDAAPPLAVVPMTTDSQAAHAWLTEHVGSGIEGVVAKRLDHGYRPGKRAWRKVKARASAEAVVGGCARPDRGAGRAGRRSP